MEKRAPSPDDVKAFLTELHDDDVTDLEPLSGGFWSSAYGYSVRDRALVARFGKVTEGFEMDRAAAERFGHQGLPIPAIVDIGAALDMSYAISERHAGRFLEDIECNEADTAGPMLGALLTGLRDATTSPDEPANWFDAHRVGASTFHDFLRAGVTDDDPTRHDTGWRAAIAADAALDRLFTAATDRIESLLDACPERRDLVHGDLLHGNVLVAEDALAVNAVFSWKCSVLGDFLYDTAWCTFWSEWHPGVGAADPWGRTVDRCDDAQLVDAAARHHCYELQIGASHMAWYVWTDNRPELDRLTTYLDAKLEAGPS